MKNSKRPKIDPYLQLPEIEEIRKASQEISEEKNAEDAMSEDWQAIGNKPTQSLLSLSLFSLLLIFCEFIEHVGKITIAQGQ